MPILSFLENSMGVAGPSARLLLGLFSAYPLAIIYRVVLVNRSSNFKNLYFTFTGLWMLYFVFGNGVWHSVVDIVAVYIVLVVFRGSLISVCLCWIITMGHLFCGYIYVMYTSQVHPITWTIPHCVLVLKLMGLAYNVYDGQQNEGKLSKERKHLALYDTPGLLEIMGFAYFFGSLLVGPQISFKRHRLFTEGQLFSWETVPSSVPVAIQRALVGLLYAGVYSYANQFFRASYLASDEYMELNFPTRIWYMIICGRVELWKFIVVWLLAEGACILSGISYEEKERNDSNGNATAANSTLNSKVAPSKEVSWYALSNVQVLRFEFSISLIDTIQCFNINTNNWIFIYVFKHLKFLGAKWLSRLVTLLFVSVWHGVWPGYYITFILEFLGTLAEATLISYLKSVFGYSLLNTRLPIRVIVWISAFCLRNFLLMYPLIVFVLLDWTRCYKFMRSVYFFYPILLTGWLILYRILSSSRHKAKSS